MSKILPIPLAAAILSRAPLSGRHPVDNCLRLGKPARVATTTLFIFLSLITAVTAAAGEPRGATTVFSLSQGNGDVGLFSPYRHGLVNELEISRLAYTDLNVPQVTYQKRWTGPGDWQISSVHTFSYPGLSLDSIAHPDIDTLLPQLLSVNNHLYFSRQFSDRLTITPSIGLALATGASPGTSSIDLSLSYPRYNFDHNGYCINTGIDIDGVFNENWGYTADLEYFSIAGLNGDSAWGHKVALFYEWKKNRRISFGYTSISGIYSYGYDARTYPMFDILWSWE